MKDALNNDYEFMTSTEIGLALAKRVKPIRKQRFKTQKLFAKHIGMSYGSYARFEKTGLISLKGFIDILRGLDRIDELSDFLVEKEEVIKW